MARKGWESLSPGYRSRLERGGISKSAYERGETIKSARGHNSTPERPSLSNPIQFPTYHSERQKLINAVIIKKQQHFGASPKWNPTRAKANLMKYAPSMASLRWAMNADYEEWLDAIRESPAEFAWLGYH
jgi:hypothetical protein